LGIQSGGDEQFDWEFFNQAKNRLADLLPDHGDMADMMRLIDLEAETDQWLYVTIDDERDVATGFLAD
jgi:hypothetical protein